MLNECQNPERLFTLRLLKLDLEAKELINASQQLDWDAKRR